MGTIEEAINRNSFKDPDIIKLSRKASFTLIVYLVQFQQALFKLMEYSPEQHNVLRIFERQTNATTVSSIQDRSWIKMSNLLVRLVEKLKLRIVKPRRMSKW